MSDGERIGTGNFERVTGLDLARWAFALALVGAGGVAGFLVLQRWTPALPPAPLAEPAMLIDLAPVPVPVPVPVPDVVDPPPEPEALPEPALPEPALPPPQALPPPPEPQAEVPPPEPEMEQPAVAEPEVEEPPPEPEIQPEPESVIEPPPPVEPEPEPEVVPDGPTPVTMSPRLRQRRAETPPTPTQQARPRPQPQAEPQRNPQPRATPSAPPTSAPAPTVSPQQWQQQALSRIDARKVYPAPSRAAGEEGAVVIRFSVSAGGQIAAVSVARSSGFPGLDQAAVETARRASPLPAPPPGLAGQPLTATIRFSLR